MTMDDMTCPLASARAIGVVPLHLGTTDFIVKRDDPIVATHLLITTASTLLRDQAECRRSRMSMKVLVAIDGSAHSEEWSSRVRNDCIPIHSRIFRRFCGSDNRRPRESQERGTRQGLTRIGSQSTDTDRQRWRTALINPKKPTATPVANPTSKSHGALSSQRSRR